MLKPPFLGFDCENPSETPCLPRLVDIYPFGGLSSVEGSTVTLKCIGLGHPSHKTYIFNKNGTQIGLKGQFKIFTLKTSDAGRLLFYLYFLFEKK